MENLREDMNKLFITKEGETLIDVLAGIRDELKKMNQKNEQKKPNSIFDLLGGGMNSFSNNENDDDEDDDEEEDDDQDDEEEEADDEKDDMKKETKQK
eukprot:764553-Hanusia_phi.AAC.2